MLNKRNMIDQIVAKLSQEFEAIHQAARAAHEAATHEESRAEDQHDTRGLEASYLAGAQASRAAELKHLISIFRQLEPREFKPGESVAPGALIQLDLNGKKFFYFLMSEGGGISVQCEGKTVQVITPQSPLGDEVLGKRAGQDVEVETQNVVREYKVVSVS